MKIALLSNSDGKGGAAIAAYRLYKGLRQQNIDLNFLVGNKFHEEFLIQSPFNLTNKVIAKIAPYFDRLPLKFFPQRKDSPFSLQWFPDQVISQLNSISADIINLHWVNAGYLQIETLAKINKPIVWTLHDMWPFTGGCHYAGNCNGYKKNCGNCPQLGSKNSCDLSRWVWKRKAKAWESLNLNIVTPSNWLAKKAKASSLFQQASIHVIPYGLDLEIFKPINWIVAREILGLPKNKKLVLFGAINSLNISRKGYHLLVPALKKINNNDEIELAIFGASEPKISIDFGLKTHYLGNFSDEVSLALIYSAVDVFVAPSIEDNLPCTVMESLACGTPVVSFRVGGIPDLVEHQLNGYLAIPYETEDLTRGILWILENSDRYSQLCKQAREIMENNFSLDQQAKQYSYLFNRIMKNFSD